MRISKEVKVGVFSSVIIILFYLSITFMKGKDLFSFHKNMYFVVYDKGGSRIGDGIYLKNINIGRVTKVKFMKDVFKVKVFFSIDKDVQITDKVIAVLRAPGIMGGRNHIALSFAGTDGKTLKSGSEVKGIIDQSLTENILSSTMPLLDDIKSTSSVISELAGNLAKNQLKINAAIANLEFLTYNVKDYILKNKDFFDSITRSIANILKTFADEKSGVKPMVQMLNLTLESLNKLNINDINDSIVELRKILTQLQKKGTTFGDLLYKGDLYQNLNKTLTSLDELLINIKYAPHRYIHLSLFGKRPVKNKSRSSK